MATFAPLLAQLAVALSMLLAPGSLDLYNAAGLRPQMPDSTACTAASVTMALNMEALAGVPTPWAVSTDLKTMETVLTYERQHMTSSREVAGSDPVGARNALNHFGGGGYAVVASATFEDAVAGVVWSIRARRPVVIIGLDGTHAMLVTGYGPGGVRLTDPMGGTHRPDAWVTLDELRTRYWQPYISTGSFLTDPATGAIGSKAWYGKWVAVAYRA